MKSIIYAIRRELIGFLEVKSIILISVTGVLAAASGVLNANATPFVKIPLVWAWGGISRNLDALQLSIWLVVSFGFAIPYGRWIDVDITMRSSTVYRYGSYWRWIGSKLLAGALLSAISAAVFCLVSMASIYITGWLRSAVGHELLLAELYLLTCLRFYRLCFVALTCSQTQKRLAQVGALVIAIFETIIFVGSVFADKWIPGPLYILNSHWPVLIRIVVSVCMCIILAAVWIKTLSLHYKKTGLNS